MLPLATLLFLIPTPAEPHPGIQASAPPAADAAVVVEWNRLAYDIAYAEDEFLTFKGQRALAMMNLAMHDALNTIAPRYARYAYAGAPVQADVRAAAAHAAYEVLRAAYPAAVGRLDSALARLRGGPGRAAELGRATALAIISGREADAWDAPGTYAFTPGVGRYQTTPEWNGFVLQPGFRKARPFVIPSVREFRPGPPPSLADSAYARAFAEVKAQGAMKSGARTADQTGFAVWWMEFAEGSVNRVARRLALERGLDPWDAARLFAHMHVALYDAYVVTWDSKYEYNHWRPYTAIRSADSDGNAATVADPEWTPLLPAPPFPEYVSAHAAGCAAAFTVMASVFGDETAFTMTTITAPDGMPERSFPGFTAAAAECADSRVHLGWHFRYATDAGLALGERVATQVLRTSLQAR
jgi:hypothetical protein